jgi:hypothetical protein
MRFFYISDQSNRELFAKISWNLSSGNFFASINSASSKGLAFCRKWAEKQVKLKCGGNCANGQFRMRHFCVDEQWELDRTTKNI